MHAFTVEDPLATPSVWYSQSEEKQNTPDVSSSAVHHMSVLGTHFVVGQRPKSSHLATVLGLERDEIVHTAQPEL